MLGWLVDEEGIDLYIPVIRGPTVNCSAIDERGQVSTQ